MGKIMLCFREGQEIYDLNAVQKEAHERFKKHFEEIAQDPVVRTTAMVMARLGIKNDSGRTICDHDLVKLAQEDPKEALRLINQHS